MIWTMERYTLNYFDVKFVAAGDDNIVNIFFFFLVQSKNNSEFKNIVES